MAPGAQFTTAAAAALALLALGAGMPPDVARGQTTATTKCGRCHAIGLSGESRVPAAPPFRVMGGTTPVGDLVGARARWAPPPHSGMPKFELPDADADALKAYILFVQTGAAEARR